MIAIARSSPTTSPTTSHHADRQPSAQDQFLAPLPAIRRHAHVAFRHLPSDARDEAINATIAHSCAAYVRLVELGHADFAYAGPLARYAVAHVREGRSVGDRLTARLASFALYVRYAPHPVLDSREPQSRLADRNPVDRNTVSPSVKTFTSSPNGADWWCWLQPFVVEGVLF